MTDKTRQDSGSTHIIRYALELGLLWIDGDGRDKVREALSALDALEAKPAPSAAGRVKLPEPDTAETAPWTGWKVKYHSPDQIIGYGNQQFNAGRQFEVERLAALWAPQLSSAPQTDSQPAVQQWNDLIGKETHADADGLLVWRDGVDFAIPKPQTDSQPAPVLDRDRIREIFMAHGFTVKEGQTDLKQYVYDAAHALLEPVAAPQQEAQEPVAWMWQHEETGRTGFVDCWQVENGFQENNPQLRLVTKLYTTPQPAPAPLSDEVLKEVIKDSNRYRWLRRPLLNAGQGSIQVVMDDRLNGKLDRVIFLDALDKAIDAALAAQGGK